MKPTFSTAAERQEWERQKALEGQQPAMTPQQVKCAKRTEGRMRKRKAELKWLRALHTTPVHNSR